MLRDSGRSEEPLARAYAEGRAAVDRLRHHVLDGWPTGAFRHGISPDEAVDTYAALCNVDVYRVLTVERRWTPDRVEDWLRRTLTQLLVQ